MYRIYRLYNITTFSYKNQTKIVLDSAHDSYRKHIMSQDFTL